MMLVGVQANNHVWIFDLKNLQSTIAGPMALTPIYDFAVSGGWALADGMLFASDNAGATKKLSVRGLAGQSLYLKDPGMVAGTETYPGSNMLLDEIEVELDDLKGQVLHARVDLTACPWLLVSEGTLGGVAANTLDATKSYAKLRFTLGRSSGVPSGTYTLKLWGGDSAGNGFLGAEPGGYRSRAPPVS